MRQIIELNSSFQSEVIEILKKYQLPTDDIDLNNQFFVGYKSDKDLIGIGALDMYQPDALLRSLVVLSNNQSKGVGTSILSYLIESAKRQKVKSLYLLTETAESFFGRHKFIRTDRLDVPKSILKSAEFSHLCPNSAVCMTLNIIE